MNRLLLVDKCALNHLGKDEDEGLKLFYCTQCTCMTKDGLNSHEVNRGSETEYLTIFRIQRRFLFDDIRFHGIKRFMEALLYRFLKGLCRPEDPRISSIDPKLSSFQNWIRTAKPEYTVQYRDPSALKGVVPTTLQQFWEFFLECPEVINPNWKKQASKGKKNRPKLISVSWNEIEKLLGNVGDYVSSFEGDPDGKEIWDLFKGMVELIRLPKIEEEDIRKAERTGRELWDKLRALFQEDITPYFHSLCFHTHDFMRRAMNLGLSLGDVACLQLLERGNGVIKNDISRHTCKFSGENGGQNGKRKRREGEGEGEGEGDGDRPRKKKRWGGSSRPPPGYENNQCGMKTQKKGIHYCRRPINTCTQHYTTKKGYFFFI